MTTITFDTPLPFSRTHFASFEDLEAEYKEWKQKKHHPKPWDFAKHLEQKRKEDPEIDAFCKQYGTIIPKKEDLYFSEERLQESLAQVQRGEVVSGEEMKKFFRIWKQILV